MGTKQHPGAYDCYAAALPDEPMFVLLARDPDAPDVVEAWARDRASGIAEGKRPPSDVHMVIEAFDCAARMRRWRMNNNGKWHVPAAITPPGPPDSEEHCA